MRCSSEVKVLFVWQQQFFISRDPELVTPRSLERCYAGYIARQLVTSELPCGLLWQELPTSPAITTAVPQSLLFSHISLYPKQLISLYVHQEERM